MEPEFVAHFIVKKQNKQDPYWSALSWNLLGMCACGDCKPNSPETSDSGSEEGIVKNVGDFFYRRRKRDSA